jgi:hypothetical protein
MDDTQLRTQFRPRPSFGAAPRESSFMDQVSPFQVSPPSYDQAEITRRRQEEDLARREAEIARREEEIARRQEEEERTRLARGEEESAKQELAKQERTKREDEFKRRKANYNTDLRGAENKEQLIELLTSYHKLGRTDPSIDSSKANNFLEKPDKLCGDKIDGQKCLDLLRNCLEGDAKKCVEDFNKMDWSKDIDIKTMNYYTARRLAEHIGFYDKTVNKAIKDLTLDEQLSEPLIAVFEAIKQRINQEEKQHISKFEVKDEEKKVPSMMIRKARPIFGIGFEVQDGGGLTSYNNLIMNLDILKTNLLMNGGGCNTSILIRSSLNTLVQLLKEQGKKIDDTDLETIHRYIFNLEKNEKKLKELREYIHILIDAISNDNYTVTNPVTLQTLEDFAKKEKTIDQNIQIKIEGLHDLFNIIIRTMNKKQDGI